MQRPLLIPFLEIWSDEIVEIWFSPMLDRSGYYEQLIRMN